MAQLSLAWILKKSPCTIPIPGTRRIKYLEENINSSLVTLPDKVIQQLNELFQPQAIAGTRYPQERMKLLDK